jgi:signal peptide peptidase SppA
MQTEQAIPYYEQWLGPWAMQENAFLQTFDLFKKLDLHLHLDQQRIQQAAPSRLQQMAGEIAVIDLTGKLMKQAASMGGGTSTVQARREIRAAANNEKVSAILLRIDSPGGTAAGTQELAQEIAAAGKGKPVWAYVEDMAASAAYWAASQADKIIANATAIVGSIGTYGVVQDLSGAAAMQGVKVHVIRAGAHKGAGTPGTEITAEQLADMQRIVNGLNEHFLSGVRSGRGTKIANLEEIADGRAWLAAEAKSMGLIDGIGSFDQTLTKLQSIANRRTGTMQTSLAESAVDAALTVELTAPPAPVVATETPRPASYQEIVTACVGADPLFICKQLADNATVAASQSAWMAEQNQRIAAAKQRPGVEPIGTKQSKANPVGDVLNDWREAVAAKMAAGLPKAKATAAVVKESPDLHQAYISAVNSAR